MDGVRFVRLALLAATALTHSALPIIVFATTAIASRTSL